MLPKLGLASIEQGVDWLWFALLDHLEVEEEYTSVLYSVADSLVDWVIWDDTVWEISAQDSPLELLLKLFLCLATVRGESYVDGWRWWRAKRLSFCCGYNSAWVSVLNLCHFQPTVFLTVTAPSLSSAALFFFLSGLTIGTTAGFLFMSSLNLFGSSHYCYLILIFCSAAVRVMSVVPTTTLALSTSIGVSFVLPWVLMMGCLVCLL